MALYPIKLLKDEKGIPFVPLTQVTAVVGEEYITGILLATKVLNGHYQIINDKINYGVINNKIISVKFPTIEETSVTSYLKLNNEEEYPIYDYEGANPITLNKLSNTTTFLIFDTDKYKMVKVSTADNVSGGGHTIIDNQGNILPQRPTLTFKGLSVNDDTATGSTIINGPILINNLTTNENNKGALDAYQGKVLLDKINTISLTPGPPGVEGKPGQGIDKIETEYYLSSSKSNLSGGEWSKNQPAWKNNKFLWTRYKITYKNPTKTEYTTPTVSSEWEAIDYLEIGGKNLFLNSHFDQLTTSSGSTNKHENCYGKFWDGYNSGIGNPTTSYHAHVDKDTFGYPVYEFNESDGSRNWKGISQTLNRENRFDTRAEAGGRYVISADIYVTGPGTKLFGGFYYRKKNGDTYSFWEGYFYIYPDNINKWKRYSETVDLGEDWDTSYGLNFYIYGYGFSDNSILYLKDIKLEKGNKSTGWAPAIEDGIKYIQDYNDNTEKIRIGYHGTGLNDTNYFAAYTTYEGHPALKDLSVSAARNVLTVPTVYIQSSQPSANRTGDIWFS